MNLRFMAMVAAIGIAAQPLAAHPAGDRLSAPSAIAGNIADEAAVIAILSRYKAAIERLDPAGTEQLFAPDSAIYETGGVEGTYANYLAHHLAPELTEFRSFKFSDYKIQVRFVGSVALATESYKYRIEAKNGEVAERLGVATSVLRKDGDHWKILLMHNSGRKPKGS